MIVLILMAFGRRMLTLLKVKADTPLEASVFSAGLGLGVMAYLVLAVGLMGVLYTWALLAILGVMALVSLQEISRIVNEIAGGIKHQAANRLSAAGSLITISAVALGGLALIAALAPPSGIDWDGLAYHLAVPKLYLLKHRIFYVNFTSHSNFPFLTEMLYTLGLSMGSIALAKLFHFWMYIFSAVAIYALGKKHFSPLVGSVGAILFMSTPVVLWEAGMAYADLATALYISLAVYALLNWEKTERTPWLVVCGLASGFALGTKVLASVPIGVMCAWILATHGYTKGWGRGWKPALLVGFIALLVGAPWYIKTYIYTGNPFYPFLYNIFGGRNWSQQDAEVYRAAQQAFGMGRGAKELLLLPWNLTMNGFKFFDSPRAFGLIGCLFLGLIPIQILTFKKNRATVLLGIISLVFLIAWFVLMQQSRYLITVLPIFSILAALGVESAAQWRIGRHAVNAFIGLGIVLSLLLGFMLAVGGARAAFGIEPQDEYLSRTLDLYEAEAYVNSLTGEQKTILFDEVRGFYLNGDYIWGNPGHHELIPWAEFKVGKDMVDFLRKMGFTHAIVNWEFANSNDFVHSELIGGALAHGLIMEVYSSNGVSVYEIDGE